MAGGVGSASGCAVLPRSEWDRLRGASSAEGAALEAERERSRRLQRLTNQSRAWVESWPDTREGHLKATLSKIQKSRESREAEVAGARQHEAERKRDSTRGAIAAARRAIFERTGYGAQIISACCLSDTLEERDLQVKFQHEYAHKKATHDSEVDRKLLAKQLTSGRDEERDRRNAAERNRECAEANRVECEIKKQALAAEKEEAKLGALEDADVLKAIMEQEEEIMALIVKSNNMDKDSEGDEAIRARRQEEEKKRAELEGACSAIYDKYQARRRRLERSVIEQKYFQTAVQTENIEMVTSLNKEKQRKHTEFIEKGIQRQEQLAKSEQRSAECAAERRLAERRRCDEANRALARAAALAEHARLRFGVLERLQMEAEAMQAADAARELERRRKKCASLQRRQSEAREHKKPSFLEPSREAGTKLERRRREPSGRSGAAQAHRYFQQYAEEALQRCRHKQPLLKLLANYRSQHGLGASAD